MPLRDHPGDGFTNRMQAIHAHAEHKHLLARLKNPGRDLGMLGVLTHVIGDAINNIGVIIAAVIIWQTSSEARFYADPAASMFIALMILLTALPLVKNSGNILLQSAPRGVDLDDVKHDIEKVRILPTVPLCTPHKSNHVPPRTRDPANRGA